MYPEIVQLWSTVLSYIIFNISHIYIYFCTLKEEPNDLSLFLPKYTQPTHFWLVLFVDSFPS